MPVLRRGLSALPMLAFLAAAPTPTLPADNPKVLNDLLQCRAIAEDAARLACFDKASAQLALAADQGDVRVVDREQVNRTRRALFGFALPSLDLFGSRKGSDKPGRSDDEEIKEITAKIVGVGSNSFGGYVLTLDDGSRWEQTDGASLGRDPKAGNSVTVKRAALGSYKMTVGTGPAMKARRIQ